MGEGPLFSVVLPTYGRGRHIGPSIESVLGQTFRDYELIVVGDGCADETELVVRSFADQRIRWRNLPHNSGSQSRPNNHGILSSRGRWIAYIGHDDIWAPHHLECVRQTMHRDEAADFVVGGCVFHGPSGSEEYYITGLFAEAEAPFRHFFPPTSIAHRRNVTPRMGGWPDPRAVKPPADNEFLLRAAHAGMRFVSTGEITVHKFAAGHRYLSYLRPSSNEQRELWRRLTHPAGIDIDEIVRRSQASGQFMRFQYGDYSSYPEGYLFEQNLKRKGISRPELRPLRRRRLIKPTAEPRGLDWHDLETNGKRYRWSGPNPRLDWHDAETKGKHYRWSGPNPRPKILLRYTGGFAWIMLEVIRQNPVTGLQNLLLHVEQHPVRPTILSGRGGGVYVAAEIALQPADYTVLTLEAPTFRPSDFGDAEDTRKLGLAVGRILLLPIAPR